MAKNEEFEREEKKKIPFDNEPIFRQKTRSQQPVVVGGTSLLLRGAVAVLCVVSVVFAVLFGVLFNRQKKSVLIFGRHTTQYAEHNTVSDGTITDTAVNIALRSTVMIESHTTSSLSSHKYVAGAGVIVSDEGDKVVIVTNYHVCLDINNSLANYIYVLLYDYVNVDNSSSFYASRRILCSYVGGSYTKDIAVICFDRTGKAETLYENSGAMPATIGNSAKVDFGDEVFAIGNPSGNGTSVTKGVVSRTVAYSTVDVNSDGINEKIRSIQIDAAINPGNSGGGLFDLNGNLIGIIESKLSSLDNTNFVIPVNVAYGVAWNIAANSGALKIAEFPVGTTTESRIVEDPTTRAISYVYDIIATSSASGFLVGDVFESISYVHPEKGAIVVDLHSPFALEEQLLFFLPGYSATIAVKRDGLIVNREFIVSYEHVKVCY